jgi:hypothetical protein
MMPDGELGLRIGRPENAVRVQRTKLGIPTFQDRRRVVARGRPG